MESNIPPDHETELRRRFDEQRMVFFRLAHERTLATNSERLLDQIRQTESLQRLRAVWRASDDPRDLGK
jgi:hypothetical protein